MNRNFEQNLEPYSLSTDLQQYVLGGKRNFLPSTSFLKFEIIAKLAEKIFRRIIVSLSGTEDRAVPRDTADLKASKIP